MNKMDKPNLSIGASVFHKNKQGEVTYQNPSFTEVNIAEVFSGLTTVELRKEWAEDLNSHSVHEGIQWDWTCQAKLNYDGNIVTVSSRFYPKHNLEQTELHGWHGDISIYTEDSYLNTDIQAETLFALRDKVEKVLEVFTSRINKFVSDNQQEIQEEMNKAAED